jgi:hypothetical protein
MDFREYASISVPRNGVPSCFLLCVIVRNGVLSVLLLFLFHGMEFQDVYSSAFCGMVQNGIRKFASIFVQRKSFLFRGTAGIPLEQTNSSVFCGIIFCRKLPMPTLLSSGSFQNHKPKMNIQFR